MTTKVQTSIVHTLEEQRQESDEEHQEDGEDTPLYPVKDGVEAVASRGLLAAQRIALRVYLTDGQLLVQSPNVQHCDSESGPGCSRRRTHM